MQIESVETAQLGGNSVVIRIDTDEGIRGYGEGWLKYRPSGGHPLVERIAEEYLIGESPAPIEKHRRTIQDAMWYNNGVVVNSALTAIEQALWDIKGKMFDVPVYELLGGPVRDKVRVYKWIGGQGNETRDNFPERVRRRMDEGLTGVKFCPTPDNPSSYPQVVDEVKETVREVREVVGPDFDLMLDPANRFKLAEAKHILSEIEEYKPLFAEDFIDPYQTSAVEKLADSTNIPIALGDRIIGLRNYEDIIYNDAAAVLQPDAAHGGVLEIKKIAAAAEHHGIRIAPHNALGPISSASAIHIDLSIPNFLIQEMAGTHFYDSWALQDYLDMDVLEIKDGYIEKPTKPGLGVEIADEVFEADLDIPESPLFFEPDDFHVPEW